MTTILYRGNALPPGAGASLQDLVDYFTAQHQPGGMDARQMAQLTYDSRLAQDARPRNAAGQLLSSAGDPINALGQRIDASGNLLGIGSTSYWDNKGFAGGTDAHGKITAAPAWAAASPSPVFTLPPTIVPFAGVPAIGGSMSSSTAVAISTRPTVSQIAGLNVNRIPTDTNSDAHYLVNGQMVNSAGDPINTPQTLPTNATVATGPKNHLPYIIGAIVLLVALIYWKQHN